MNQTPGLIRLRKIPKHLRRKRQGLPQFASLIQNFRARLIADLNHHVESVPNPAPPDRNSFSLKKLKAFIVRPIRTSSNDSLQTHQPSALHHTVSTPARSTEHA